MMFQLRTMNCKLKFTFHYNEREAITAGISHLKDLYRV